MDLWKRDNGILEITKTSIPLVVVGKLAGLRSNPLEEIVDKRVHD